MALPELIHGALRWALIHMSRLRGKVDRGHKHELIHTVRGAGYCLREPD